MGGSMIGKALVLSMLLLANKSGNISTQVSNIQTDTRIAAYEEPQETQTGFGAYEDGEITSSGQSGESDAEQNTRNMQTTQNTGGKANEGVYPKKAYTYDKDGSWVCEDNHYLYRFELIGRNEGATEKGRFLVLTNDAKMTFERVSKSFTSENPEDKLDKKHTIVVEAGWYR